MEEELIVAGIGRGGMTDKYQIKILICYLLSAVSSPFTREMLDETFHEAQIVNYFHYCEALGELLATKHIAESEEGYHLNPLGLETAQRLARSLPQSIRDNVVQTAMKMIAKKQHEKENEVLIEPYKNGYRVICTIHDLDFDLMQISLYAPDLMQAEILKKRFMNDPSGFYQNVINYLTNE